MSPTADQKYRGLDIEEEMHVKRLTWRGEVIEYAVLLAVVVAALLGLFGNGWLSDREVRTESGFTVRWERFQRHERPTILEVELTAGNDDRGQLTFSDSLLERWTIESVEPQPTSQTPNETSVTYVFPMAPNAKTGRVVFELMPKRVGRGTVRLSDGTDAVSVNALVYP